MRVEFLRDYDYPPSAEPRSVVYYKGGKVYPVKRECADMAIAAGAAKAVSPMPQEADDGLHGA